MSRKNKNKDTSSENTAPEESYYNIGHTDTEQQLPKEVHEKVNRIHDMFKDWDKEYILHALKENNYDFEEVIRRKIEGDYQFTEVKKPKTKAEIRESRKKFRGGKTRGRGRQRGGMKPQPPKERRVQKKQVEKKEEKPTVEKTGGEVRTFQPVQTKENVNVNRTLSYSEVAAQRTAPVHVVEEEETQPKRKSKKKKDKKKKKALEQQPVEQTHPQIEDEEQIVEETHPTTTGSLVQQQQKSLPTMPSYPTQPQQRRKDSGGEVILPKTQNFDFENITLQFGSLGISEQEKSRPQQLVQPTSNILGAQQQPSQEQLKPSQNTQTEGWDNRYAQFNQPFHQPNFYGYPEYTSEAPKQPMKKDAQTTEEGKGTQTVPPNYKFMPPYTQYGQYYPSYPPYMMPNQFQYQGYPQKFPQGPFYGKQMYGYGNYPGYEEMDYTKYNLSQQQMYYMPQQPQQQPTGQTSQEEKSQQQEEQEGYEHGYGHEMYQMPYGQYSSYMYQQPMYPNQPYMQTPQGKQPKQPTQNTQQQDTKGWKYQ